MLDFHKFKRENSLLLERIRNFGKSKALGKYKVLEILANEVKRIEKDDKNFILKKSQIRSGIASSASSNMYNKIGIKTPKIELFDCEKQGYLYNLQEDISSIAGLETLLANDNLEYLQIQKSFFGSYKWQIFYDSDLNHAFLQFMTRDCLEQLKNAYLADELRTDGDRWLQNMFLYRTPGNKKYDGVILIDLEAMTIFYHNAVNSKNFERFLLTPYYTSTPQQTNDSSCYKKRVEDIIELIQDGVLSKSNIETIRAVLNYDFPKELEEICSKQAIYGAKRQEIVEPIKRLWEYNNKNIDKELN